MCEVGFRELGVLQPNTLVTGPAPLLTCTDVHTRIFHWCYLSPLLHFPTVSHPLLVDGNEVVERVVVSGTQATGPTCVVWSKLGWALASFQL